MVVYLACPKCGHQFKQFRTLTENKWEVVYCPNEDGGCDEPMAVYFQPRIDVVIHEINSEPLIPQESA